MQPMHSSPLANTASNKSENDNGWAETTCSSRVVIVWGRMWALTNKALVSEGGIE